MNNEKLSCWIITEGIAGTENQCLGVAEAFGTAPKVMKIGLHQPWKTLSPWLGFEQSCTFTPAIAPPWPDLLIAAGRKSVAASRYIKRKSGGKTFTVQLQDPKTSPNQFDLVAAPIHDGLEGSNVITTHGAPNRITPEKLEQARKEFAPLFEPLASSRVALMIGGNSRTHQLTPEIVKNLVNQLEKQDISLMITTSRRTGEENTKIIKDTLKGKNTYFWDGKTPNPYFGMLAWADHILVTADSVSMLSDAGTTGKPVHMIPLEGGSARFNRFHKHLQDIGVMRPFSGNFDSWTYEPLNDAGFIAKEIDRRLG